MQSTDTYLGKSWVPQMSAFVDVIWALLRKQFFSKPLVPVQFWPQILIALSVAATKECPENNHSSVPLDLECMRN